MPWRIPRTSPVTRIPTAAGSKEGTKVVPVLRSALGNRLAGSCACCNMSHQQPGATLRPWIRGGPAAGSPASDGVRERLPIPDDPVQSVVRTEVRSHGDVWIRQGLAPGEREPRM